MPNYEYRCLQCGLEGYKYFTFEQSDTPVSCPNCLSGRKGILMEKVLGVSAIIKSYNGGYNPTVGKYVSGMREFKSDLARASEEASIRTGIPHNYVPVDLNDRVACNISDEAVDATKRRQVEIGKHEVKKWL